MPPEEVNVPARINVIGVSGSGKSTFSTRLAALTGIPRVEMDRLYWKPAWTDPTDDEFFAKLAGALEGDEWILDGNYSRTTPVKWRRAQLVIWLDYPFATTLWQSVTRSIARAIDGRELWPGTGNRESFRQTFFSRKSIVLWMITSWKRTRVKYSGAMADPGWSHIEFVRLTTRREADAYCERLAERLRARL